MTHATTDVVRFAPSPTGTLHLGNARTALFNWLYARHYGATMVLRIEDTDRERSRPEYEHAIIEDLRWLGIDWDQGPDCGGAAAPFRQSEAGDWYRSVIERLRAQDAIYPCFCTQEQLEQDREAARASGGQIVYSRRCRDLDAETAQRRIEQGDPHVWRLRLPESLEHVTFKDLVRGEVRIPIANFGGDFVLLRTDGSPVFHLAVVADDHRMGVTLVLRGEDHLVNTARQICLYRALDWEPPRWGHMAMILGADRTKLSKRHGGVSVRHYREQGVLPQALMNYLALLGWNPGDDTEVMRPGELIERFSVDRLIPSAAVFDETKLYWLNAQHLRALDEAAYLDHARNWIVAYAPAISNLLELDGMDDVLLALREQIQVFSELPGALTMFQEPGIDLSSPAVDKVVKMPTFAPIIDAISKFVEAHPLPETAQARRDWLDALKQYVSEQTGAGGRKLFQPIRLALTGVPSGRDLGVLIAAMPADLVHRRLEIWRQHIAEAVS
ncbi:MAG: glutamate--tRNA ligase [Candidatus Dadabacteria bacterium]|nr:MAG: glutamate--tRNA ligase [Candidatus Dadabacteria bacterium]